MGKWESSQDLNPKHTDPSQIKGKIDSSKKYQIA